MTLPESTPPSQNLRPFSTIILLGLCDAPRIYPSLPPEYTPFQQLYATLPEITPPSENISLLFDNYMPPPSQNIFLLTFLQLYAIFQESTPQSLNMSAFLDSTCICERINHSLPELKIFWEEGADSGEVA